MLNLMNSQFTSAGRRQGYSLALIRTWGIFVRMRLRSCKGAVTASPTFEPGSVAGVVLLVAQPDSMRVKKARSAGIFMLLISSGERVIALNKLVYSLVWPLKSLYTSYTSEACSERIGGIRVISRLCQHTIVARLCEICLLNRRQSGNRPSGVKL